MVGCSLLGVWTLPLPVAYGTVPGMFSYQVLRGVDSCSSMYKYKPLLTTVLYSSTVYALLYTTVIVLSALTDTPTTVVCTVRIVPLGMNIPGTWYLVLVLLCGWTMNPYLEWEPGLHCAIALFSCPSILGLHCTCIVQNKHPR